MKKFLLILVFLSACSRPLPILGTLPDFSLTNQNGTPVQKADFLGKIWVADFIFTSCPTVCPMLTMKMKELESMTNQFPHREDLRFVSFTVDPQNDTPARLKSYAERFEIDLRDWSFLTGRSQELEETIVRGFKIGMGRDAEFQLVHGEKFVLVDQKAQIRGYYDADKAGLRQLSVAIKILLETK